MDFFESELLSRLCTSTDPSAKRFLKWLDKNPTGPLRRRRLAKLKADAKHILQEDASGNKQFAGQKLESLGAIDWDALFGRPMLSGLRTEIAMSDVPLTHDVEKENEYMRSKIDDLLKENGRITSLLVRIENYCEATEEWRILTMIHESQKSWRILTMIHESQEPTSE